MTLRVHAFEDDCEGSDAPQERARWALGTTASEAITMMFWYGHNMAGVGHTLMFISMIAFWGVLISLVIRPPARFRSSGRLPTPEQVLAGRFARGEIDHDEYASRQAALNAHARS